MKRRWLIAIASLAMAITFVFGVTACKENPNNSTKSDEEIAQTAINTLDSLYIKDGAVKNYETPDNYTVLGQVNVDGTLYPVTWTPTAKTESVNIAECVTIGEKDSKGQVTVGITRKTVDVEYTLTASVTAGQATKTTQYDHKIPKKSSEDATTATLSFATADARVSQTATQQVWKNNGITFTNNKGTGNDIVDSKNPVRIYAGSIVTIEFNNMTRLDFHCDTPNFKNTYPTDLKNSIEAAYPTATVTVDEDTRVVTVVLAGPVNSITFTMKKQVRLDSLDVEGFAGELSDAQKVAAAKGSLSLPQTLFFEQNTVTLTTENNGATIAWSIKETTTNASIESGKLKVTTLPTAETKLTLVATITSGEESDTAEFQITLKPQPTLQHAGTQADPYSAADVIAISNLLTSGSYYMKDGANAEIYVKGYIIAGTWSSTYNNFDKMYIADSDTSTTDSADALQIFGLGKDDQFITGEDLVMGASITILGGIQNYSGKAEIALQPQTVALEDSRTPDQKVESALNGLKDVTVTKTGDVELTTSSGGVAFTWALKSGETLPEGTTFANGKLTVTKLPATDTTVKFVVTAKLTGATDQTREVSVTIKAEGAEVEGFTPITAPAAGSDYYLAMDINGTWYYSTGAMSSHYLGTTTDISKAAKVTVAASGSGWTLFTNGKFIEIEKVDTYNNIVLNDSATEGKVWMWDAAHAVFTMTVGTDTFFMGTFGDYTTFNAAYTSYLDSDNEYIGKIGTYTGAIEPGPGGDDATLPNGDVKLDFSSVTEKGSEIAEGDATEYFKGFTTSADLTAATVTTKVYKGNGTGGGEYANAGGMLKMGTGSVGASITLTFAKNVTKVVILAQGWPGKSDTLAVNKGTAQTMSGSEKALYTFELTAPAKEIEITSNLRAFIFGIVVTFEGGENPQPSGTLELTDATLFPNLDGTSYDTYNGTHTVGKYTVTTTNVLGNTQDGYTETYFLQFKANAGELKVTGSFTKIVIKFVSTYDADNTGNKLTITAGSTTLTPVVKSSEKTGVSNSKGFEYSTHTVEYAVTVAGEQTITIKKDTAYAAYVSSITFEEDAATTPETDDSKVEKALAGVDATLTVEEAGDFALPTSKVDGVTFTWSTEDKTYTVAGGALKVEALPKADVTIVLTLTATCNQATKTKQVTVTIKAEEPFKPITTPVAAINYYMGMKTQDGKYHYLTGAMSGYYMATTTDIAQAKKVTLAGNDTDGWTMMLDGKYIEIAISGSHINAVYVATQTSSRVWKWDSQYNIFTMEISGTKYFLGTNGSFTTVGGGNYNSYVATNYLAVLGLYGDETAQLPSDQNYAQQVLDSLTIPEASATLNKVGATLTLPTSTQHGATVVWTATGANASLVSIAENKLTVVSIPQTESQVTLHCVVTVNGASANKDFTITVRDLNDKEKADEAVTALDKEFKTADKYFWTLDKVVTLPTENSYSATVEWTLAEESTEWMKLENNKLSVLKLYEAPNYGKTTIKLTLTVTVGEEVSTKEYSLTLYAEDTFTAATSAPKYGYYFIEAKNPTNGERTLANGKVSGSNGAKGSNLQHHTADSEAGLFLLVPVPNQENSYWLKFTDSTNRTLKDYLGITVLSNGVALSWGSSWNSNSETTTKSSIWHWDDERDILYVTIAEKNYVLGTTYAQTITPIAMEDAIKNTGYWWAKIGSISTRQADIDNVPPQATSVEFYDVNGKKLTSGVEISLKAESGWGALLYYKVLPANADQSLTMTTSEANKLNNLVNSDILSGIDIKVGSGGAVGDEVTVTFTVKDTAITFELKVKIVSSVTAEKGETADTALTIDELIARVKKVDDVYEGAKVQAGAGRPFYVTGKVHKAEDGTYYLQDEDGTQIQLSKRLSFKGEAAGLTADDLVEGETLTVANSWNFVKGEDDVKTLASSGVATVYKASVETDDEKIRNVQGRLEVDFTSIKGIDAVGKYVDLTAMANAAKAAEYGVTVTWALTAPADAATYLELKDNKLTVLKLLEKSTTFTLTATISKEDIETPLTKTFTFREMSTTADVDIAAAAEKLTLDFSGLKKVGDTLDLKAAETAAVVDTKVYVSWSVPSNAYWTVSSSVLTVKALPEVETTFTLTANVSCTYGTTVKKAFTFTLGPTEPAASVTFTQQQQGTFKCSMKPGEDGAPDPELDASDVPDLVVSEHSITWGDKVITNLQANEGDPNSFTFQIGSDNYGLNFMGGWMLAKLGPHQEMLEGYMFGDMGGFM